MELIKCKKCVFDAEVDDVVVHVAVVGDFLVCMHISLFVAALPHLLFVSCSLCSRPFFSISVQSLFSLCLRRRSTHRKIFR